MNASDQQKIASAVSRLAAAGHPQTTTCHGYRAGISFNVVPFSTALVNHAPAGSGKLSLARSILYSDMQVGKDGPCWLAAGYVCYLFIPLYSKSGQKTAQPPRTHIPNLTDNKNLLGTSARRQEAFRARLLRREGCRCAITGGGPTGAVPVDLGVVSHLEASHILPFSLGHYDATDSTRIKGAAVTLIETWSDFRVQAWFGAGINSVRNGILLSADAHAYFDNYDIWLEPEVQNSVPVANAYVVRSRCPSMDFAGIHVQFTDASNHIPSIDLPSRRALAIYAAFAKVIRGM
ncbi:hypothetical protein P691DRAFT_774924 [Macrolepiota fuliginosa MF-IS2]|uniref:HNH nuclease domain-containing protein n=1 Tax=Macrolepiota fuliginosa MF-IS2 TaxID=1400762 RepID=A0A9P6C218_9AGAR|nr:hypothetical protein P691DRAFT_774924 [Macrolepiota fuliginosa MF-IS2]